MSEINETNEISEIGETSEIVKAWRLSEIVHSGCFSSKSVNEGRGTSSESKNKVCPFTTSK